MLQVENDDRQTGSASTSASASNCSSSDDEADEAHTAGSSRARDRRTISMDHMPATPVAAAAKADHAAARHLLTPLQLPSTSILPCFVRLQRAFRCNQVNILCWQGNPLQGAAAGTKVDVELSVTLHKLGCRCLRQQPHAKVQDLSSERCPFTSSRS